MAHLPELSGNEVVAAFRKFGWAVASTVNHVIMVKDGQAGSLSVPNHRKVAKGTLRSLIRDAGLTVDEFVAAT